MSLNENSTGVKFFELERMIYDMALELGRKVLAETLEAMSQGLHMQLDSSRYENKGIRETHINTLFGTVAYHRHVYYDRDTCDEDGKCMCIYPLDERLGMAVFQSYTEAVVETVVKRCTQVSFRKAAEAVSEMTGLSISHGTAWNMVQRFGHGLDEYDKQLVEKDRQNQLDGERVVPVIFEEADGDYLPIQRRNRKKKEKERREVKLAVTYEGWKKEAEPDRYHVVNKRFVAGVADMETFNALRSASIAQRYDMSSVKYHVLNGDGAAWIRAGHEGRKNIYQNDPFHWHREVLRATADKKEAAFIIRLVKAGEHDKALRRINELMFECGGVETRVKALQRLEVYLNTLQEGLRPWNSREGKIIPEPPAGIEYRNLGTMEHHICDVIGLRMKGRKMSWSIAGASHMAKVLACSKNGDLSKMIESMMNGKVPEVMTGIVTRTMDETGKRVLNHVQKTFEAHHGGWPFEGGAMTLSRKAIRDVFHMKNFTELAYH